jgi:GDPmannose 4,6-dehydratase
MNSSDCKRALVTGVTGQDGSYLTELLLEKGYEVWGMVRRTSSFSTSRIDHLYHDAHESGANLRLVFGDLTDGGALRRIVEEVRPHEVYNLAAQSHVKVSFEVPEYTCDVTGLGALRLLEAVRQADLNCRFYQASSSEMFGLPTECPQTEGTPLNPRSPYATAKAFAYHSVRQYREAYGMFAVNGILFNHESPRRGETFVTRKITRAAARIKLRLQEKLYLGNLEARRDWGFAGDYVDAIWRMMQTQSPRDYVVATGQQHRVRDFCEASFAAAGLPITWSGSGDSQQGRGPDGRVLVEIDPRYYRPSEVDNLCGDASLAKQELGWSPVVSFLELVQRMTQHDLKLAESEASGQAAATTR